MHKDEVSLHLDQSTAKKNNHLCNNDCSAMPASTKYQDTLDYIFSRLPMFQKVGAIAYKKDLTNARALCAHLGDPHGRFPSVHIGGTNGKGSVSHFLAAICQAAGLKVGLYTSPHYKDFRERIKINGRYIPRERVTAFVEKNKATLEAIQPSFFEMSVALAFDYFAQEKVDIAVIEVGLGGRLDSTNVITPLLSVITNISYDHMDILGDTLDKIAFEKAGIIKPGVPVVIGETHPESAPVFLKQAQEVQAPIVFADQRYELRIAASDNAESGLEEITHYDILRERQAAGGLQLQGGGPYQPRNLATVLQAWEVLCAQPDFLSVLKNKKISTEAPALQAYVQTGLARLRDLTRFVGRWQIIGRNPTILCDSAHIVDGMQAAFDQISRVRAQLQHIVCGFVADKDLNKALRQFPTQATYYFAKANIPRGLDAAALRAAAAERGLHGKSYTSVKNALAAAKRAAAKDDLIVVIGSIFVVAEVL